LTKAPFWDDPQQGSKAASYAKRHGLNIRDPEVKRRLREMYRKREGRDPKTGRPLEGRKLDPRLVLDKIPRNATSLERLVALHANIHGEDSPFPHPTGFDSRTMTACLPSGERVPVKHPVFGTKPPTDEEWIEYYLGGTLLPTRVPDVDPITGVPRRDHNGRVIEKEIEPKLYKSQSVIVRFLGSHPRAKLEIFRGAGKTVVVIGLILRAICDNPEERICFQSEVEEKTVQRIKTIRRELMENQRIIKDYGYLPADEDSARTRVYGKRARGKMTEAVIEIKRKFTGIEPTVMGISWQSSGGLGYHFTGVILDDPWSRKNQGSEKDYQRFWSWMDEFTGSCEQAKFVWVLCTKKGANDVYAEMDARKMFSTLRQPLVIKFPPEDKIEFVEDDAGGIAGIVIRDKEPEEHYVFDTCMGKYTIENVLLMRRMMSPRAFKMEYQLEATPEDGSMFKWADARWIDPSSPDPYARVPFEKAHRMKVVFVYDPALGESERASLNVLLAMGKFQARYYVLRSWVGHWNRRERVKVFREAMEMYPAAPFYIEEAFAQARIIRTLLEDGGLSTIRLRSVSPKIKSVQYNAFFRGDKYAAKKGRIADALENPWYNNRIYLAKDLDELRELEAEIKSFPNRDRLDFMDALAMGIHVLEKHGGIGGGLTSGRIPHSPIHKSTLVNTFHFGRA